MNRHQSSPSPYSAPNTPIASSKRPRQMSSTKADKKITDAKSPEAKLRKSQSIQEDVTKTPDKREALISAIENFNPASMTTTKGVLFSPLLRKQSESSEPVVEKAVEVKSSSSAVAAAAAEDDDGGDDEFNPFLFISSLPPHSDVCDISKICLPAKLNDKPTLALDLDETLVHCTVQPFENPDLIFPVVFNGSPYKVYVRKRPYLDHFLATVSKFYEVVVFTASQRVYADVLLDLLDRKKEYVDHRLFREACLNVEGNFIKDLTVLNRDLSKTVLVDNSPHAYAYQIDNGIPIESWFDDPEDTELLKLIDFLARCREPPGGDVRALVHSHFQTFRRVENARRGVADDTPPPMF